MAIASAIESALDSECLVDEPGAFLIDDRPADVVAAPSSIDQLSELLKLAAAEGWAVVPAGLGGWLAAGNPLERSDLVISTRRLADPIEHHPDDLLATVRAGTPLATLNETLRPAGQWWPLDPLGGGGGGGGGSVGAIVATAAAGPLAASYGTPRDLVLGLTVALADGRVIKAGGRVVKNVAGYDMVKLFTGSWGTLGIIAEAHLRLHPLPPDDRSLALSAESAETLASLARELLRMKALAPAAAEILSPPAAPALGLDASETQLIVRWLGHELAVGGAMSEARRLAGVANVKAEERDVPWSELSDIEERLKPAITLRSTAAPLATDELLALALSFAGGDAPAVVAAPYLGRVWTFISAAAYGEAPAEEWAGRIQGLRNETARLAGRVRLERAPADLRALIDAWGDPGGTLPLQRALKDKFDPDGILNRGRFVGGL